jgi:hypothetical protein
MMKYKFYLLFTIFLLLSSNVFASLYVSQYSSLTTAVQAAGGANVDLVVDVPTTCSTTTVVPSNIKLVVMKSGKINQGAYDLTVYGPLEAGLYQIFTGSGSGRVSLGSRSVAQVYPEWWGETLIGGKYPLQWAVASISRGAVKLLPKTYFINSPLVITTDGVGIQGSGANSSFITTTSPSEDVIQVTGKSSARVNYPFFRDFGISRSAPPTDGAGIRLTYTAHTKVFDVTITDSRYGVFSTGTASDQMQRVIVVRETGPSDFYGFFVNGNGQNMSIEFRDCLVHADRFSGTSYGLFVSGTYIQDTWVDALETSRCTYGIYIRSGVTHNFDIHIVRPVLDNSKTAGIYIADSMNDGTISIIGGWTCALDSGSQSYGVLVSNSRGVTISGHQFFGGPNHAQNIGLYLLNSQNVQVTGCLFRNNVYGIYANNALLSAISGCNFFNLPDQEAARHISLVASDRFAITGNVFDENAGCGIYLGPNSDKSAVMGNIFNGVGLTSKVINNGTGNDIAHNN